MFFSVHIWQRQIVQQSAIFTILFIHPLFVLTGYWEHVAFIITTWLAIWNSLGGDEIDVICHMLRQGLLGEKRLTR